MITRSLLTPISAAVSGFCATARTPRPYRVRLMNWSSAIIIASAATTVISWMLVIVGVSRW